MNKNLEKKLKDNFPKLLSNMYNKESCLAWGVQCDDGWYDLIYNCCKELQDWCDKNSTQIQAEQIKEKFGTLRYYLKSNNELGILVNYWTEINEIIDKYETISASTCELTGGKGSAKRRGYLIKTLCDESAVLYGFVDGPKIKN